jgi:sn-glycerol 3-phosphate transport system permease protein
MKRRVHMPRITNANIKSEGGVVIKTIKTKKPFTRVVEPYLYLLPGLLLFALFVFFPLLKTIYLSLTNTDPQGNVRFFVGLGNYVTLFKSDSFRNSLIVTGRFALMVVVPCIILGFILAVLANSKLRGMGIFRTIYALPMAISSAAAAIIWMFLLHPSMGLINYVFNSNIGWLTDPKWGIVAVVIVTVWMNLGINYIFMIAGLQGIPEDLYESAAIDGAGVIRKHWSITIPSLSPIIFFLLVIDVINTFQIFGQVNLMTKGGPGESTNVLVYSIYRDAFFNNRFDMASAESIVLFIIILVLTIIQFKVGEKRVNY